MRAGGDLDHLRLRPLRRRLRDRNQDGPLHARARGTTIAAARRLARRRRRYPGGVVTVLCIARARHVERVENDVLLVVSLDRPAACAARGRSRRVRGDGQPCSTLQGWSLHGATSRRSSSWSLTGPGLQAPTSPVLPMPGLDARLAQAHTVLPISLEDPGVFAFRDDQRRALCARLELAPGQADDLSRWVLEQPRPVRPERPALLADRLRRRWLALADEQLAAGRARRAARRRVRRARRPATAGSSPRCSRWTRSGCSPRSAAGSTATCAPRRCPPTQPRELLGARQRAHAARRARRSASTRPASSPRRSRASSDARRARACRATSATAGAACSSRRRSHTTGGARSTRELGLRVVTFPARGFRRRRLGAVALDERHAQRERGDGARRGGRRPRSSAGCRCCCPPRPPGSSRTPSASGA